MSQTHPNAFKMEADDKRAQAARLLSEADQLDPQPLKKERKAKAARSAVSGKFVSKGEAKRKPKTTVVESK